MTIMSQSAESAWHLDHLAPVRSAIQVPDVCVGGAQGDDWGDIYVMLYIYIYIYFVGGRENAPDDIFLC